MTMLKTLENISRHIDGRHVINGLTFKVMDECDNHYYSEQLTTIPAGSEIVADFAGDFGMYGVTEVDGVLHRIKVELRELHKINFGEFDARDLAAL